MSGGGWGGEKVLEGVGKGASVMVMVSFFIREFVKWVCSICENTWICMTLFLIFYTESMLHYFLSLLSSVKCFQLKTQKLGG